MNDLVEQASKVSNGTPTNRMLVKTRLMYGTLLFADTINSVRDKNIPLRDYFLGIAPVVLVVSKEDNDDGSGYGFLPVHHFESNQL